MLSTFRSAKGQSRWSPKAFLKYPMYSSRIVGIDGAITTSMIAPARSARCWVFERIKRIWNLRLYMKTGWETWIFWRSMRLSYWIWLDQTSAPSGQEKEKRNSNCPPPRAFQSTILCFQYWAPTFAKMNWSDAVNGPGKVVEPHADCTAMHVFTTFTDADVSLEQLGNCCQVGFAWWTPRPIFFRLQQNLQHQTTAHTGGEAHDSDSNHRGLYRHSVWALVLPWCFCCSSPDVRSLNLRRGPVNPYHVQILPVKHACLWQKCGGEEWDLQIGSQVAMCQLWVYGTSMLKLQLLVPDAF